ncbi:MAG: 5'-methylthioadenosine/S-adenosylhomocysteine nucleosidase [Rhodospirillales bacterium]|nr:5'-methylthioadenosine/S-adenosylhomocysteine nucleosidase [Rhodospirillales bacterium]MCB9979681.1 5'-methylthioadenosine/S-adenosylhomocysteine nucleosidase [Rhodospirillales bacterium]
MTADLDPDTDPLLVFALKEESCGQFNDYSCLYTGVGKVNAAYGLMHYLATHPRPSLLINLGTAGSAVFPPGNIVQCSKFIQRDMDVTPLGVDLYKTPFSDMPVILEAAGPILDLPQGICGTGDHFDTAHQGGAYDVVDMEAYALAMICHREKIPFLCIKYISDGADDTAHLAWEDALEQGAKALRAGLESFDRKGPQVFCKTKGVS